MLPLRPHRAYSTVPHYTAGATWRRSDQARKFLHTLPSIVESFVGCDVLLDQAGADAHVDDPLGGWLTTAQLAERDRIVFETAHRIGLPLVWNLAGGYPIGVGWTDTLLTHVVHLVHGWSGNGFARRLIIARLVGILVYCDFTGNRHGSRDRIV